FFEPVYQAEKMVEGFDGEQQGLIMMNLERLIDGPLELNRIALHLRRFDGVLDLSIRAEQSASVYLEIPERAHESEFDGEPEEARHRANDAGQRFYAFLLVTDAGYDLRGRMGALAEADQRIGEMPVRVHRHMAGDVVKDIGFRQIIQLVGAANCDGGG